MSATGNRLHAAEELASSRHGAEAGERVRAVVRGFLPSWFAGSLEDDSPLGSSGLGLDSVAIVELLVACEASFGVPFPDSLLDAPPLTIGRLTAHLSTALPSRSGSPA